MTFSQGHICQCLSKISLRDSPATIFGSRRKSGRQFADGIRSLAGGLSELGIRRGDVVALAALNSDWYLEWLLAIAFVGGIAAPLNYRWSFEEARWAMEVAGPKMLVVDESCEMWLLNLQSADQIIPSLKTIVFIGSSLPTLNNIFNVLSQDEIRKPLEGGLPSFNYLCAPRGVALICFTSGTTGRPKGAAISHTALIVQSLAKMAIVGYGENDVYLHTAPLCHIGGISSAMGMLMVGASHVFIPKFDAKEALQAIHQHHVTSLITLPTIIADLVSVVSKKKTKGGGESVKKILNGGGSLSNELIKRATLIFPNAKLLSAYGMTEACSSLTFMTLWDPTIPNTSKLFPKNSNECRQGGICVGKPAPHVELLITGGDHNNDPSSVGRILTRGQHVMVGYWGETPATMQVSGELQWLETGDMGYFDANGDLWLMGRAKDRIKSGGENVYSQEVEGVISQHPGVLDTTVFGVPHQRLMEMVTACIRVRQGWRWSDPEYSQNQEDGILSQKILQNYCKHRNLTGFKIPKLFILWRKPFPTTTTGKTRRDEVRKEAISLLQFMPSNL